jgi:hypothetical protein
MKKLFLFFISLFFGLFLQNAFLMDEKPPADISKSCDDDADDDEDTGKIFESLAYEKGKQAYKNAFSVLSSIIGTAARIKSVGPGTWKYFLKKDISAVDLKTIQDAFSLIKSNVKKTYYFFSDPAEEVPVLTITLNEDFRCYRD